MSGNGIRNRAVGLDGFFQQSTSGGLYKQRNRTVDHRNQSWNYNVFAAQGNGRHCGNRGLKEKAHFQKVIDQLLLIADKGKAQRVIHHSGGR